MGRDGEGDGDGDGREADGAGEPAGVAPAVVPLTRAVAFPEGTDVLALARAWFPASERLRAPTAPPSRRLVGARFAARLAPEGGAGPGLLRVTGTVDLRGPLAPATPTTLPALPPHLPDVYRVEPNTGGDPRFTAWLLAAARRTGGVVVDDEGRLLAPLRDEHVALTVHAALALTGDEALAVARTVAPMMRPVGALARADYELAFETPYDGTVLLRRSEPSDPPASLWSAAAASSGPYAYAVSWVPPGAAAAPDSVVGRIARERVVPLVARLARTLRERTGGTVVDADGFVLPVEDLERRASR